MDVYKNDKLVELSNCIYHNRRTGQHCVDPKCRICQGTGKYWRENAAVAGKLFSSLTFDIHAQRSLAAPSFGAVAASFLNMMAKNIFNHGCEGSGHPCEMCDRFGTVGLFADLVHFRAEQMNKKGIERQTIGDIYPDPIFEEAEVEFVEERPQAATTPVVTGYVVRTSVNGVDNPTQEFDNWNDAHQTLIASVRFHMPKFANHESTQFADMIEHLGRLREGEQVTEFQIGKFSASLIQKN